MPTQLGPKGDMRCCGVLSVVVKISKMHIPPWYWFRSNLHEDLSGFIIEARPERWKLLPVLPVAGQDSSRVGDHLVSAEEFWGYVENNRSVEELGITVVPEDNDLMTGSYVMVDPAGRFFDNAAGTHTYSRPILEVGVGQALMDVSVDGGKFLSRSGMYAW